LAEAGIRPVFDAVVLVPAEALVMVRRLADIDSSGSPSSESNCSGGLMYWAFAGALATNRRAAAMVALIMAVAYSKQSSVVEVSDRHAATLLGQLPDNREDALLILQYAESW
jgi:uncharacterized membrane protein YhaH (DUF805 family)